MKRDEIEKEIREDWFKDHIAEFTKLSDRVATLSWGKPNSSFYYTRYVFDGSKLYISGDLGEAVFCLTEKADINSIKDYDIQYFHKKMTAFCDGKYSFDSDIAVARIKEEIEEALENKDIDEDGVEEKTDRNKHINRYIKVLRELIEESKCCYFKNSWEYEVNQRYDDLSDWNSECYEWIYKAGDAIPNRVYGYLIGIKMAVEQLNRKEIDS